MTKMTRPTSEARREVTEAPTYHRGPTMGVGHASKVFVCANEEHSFQKSA